MYSIGEMCRALGLTRNALIYYEKQGIIHPRKGGNGYRDYSQDDLRTLCQVSVLRSMDMPTEEIARFFRTESPQIKEELAARRRWVEEKITYYQALLESLDQMLLPVEGQPRTTWMPKYYLSPQPYFVPKAFGNGEDLIRQLPFCVCVLDIDMEKRENTLKKGHLAIREDYMDVLKLDREQYRQIGGCQAVTFSILCKWDEGIIQEVKARRDAIQAAGGNLKNVAYGINSVALPEDAGSLRIQIFIPTEEYPLT